MRIGFIGLGNMGFPMARNLLRAGLDVTVFNRTRSKSEELEKEGARVADSVRQVAGDCDIVHTCLSDVPVTRDVFLGAEGLVASARRGQILVDHATVDVATSRELFDKAAARDVDFLDAPISGGPGGAEAATLSIMVGGRAEAFERARAAFEAMGKTIVHMGESGTGTATKLANQLLVGVHTLAACEALTLAREAGVDVRKLIEVLEQSWGASRMLDRNAPNIVERRFGPSNVPLRNLLKDVSIVSKLGEQLGVSLPATAAAEAIYRRLADAGQGECDITAACELLEPGGR